MLEPHSPEQNTNLAALPASEYERLLPTAVCNRHHAVDQQLCRWLLIHYSRGKITVPDQTKLETLVCECHGMVKRESDRLLSDTTADAGGVS